MVGTPASNWSDYQASIDQAFSDFLEKRGVSKITRKNYRTDLRHFLAWARLPIDQVFPFKRITTPLFDAYKQSQILSKTPPATINRRLSTIRMFFRCAIAQGWVTDNPTKNIVNILPQLPAARLMSAPPKPPSPAFAAHGCRLSKRQLLHFGQTKRVSVPD